MTSCEKLISILKNEPAVSRGGQRLGPWEKGDKNPPWGWGCVTIGFFLLLKLTGDVPLHIRTEQVKDACNYRVIFVTPECLEDAEPLREKIDELVRLNKLEWIVFDEAHTISTWGSTFRPKYKTVCESLSTVDCPKMFLSATISAYVESDVRSIFGNFKLYRTSVFRDWWPIFLLEWVLIIKGM